MYNFEQLNKKSNKVRTLKEDCILKDMQFKKLKEFEGQTLHVEGFLRTTGTYGEQVVVIANGYKVNMPARAYAQFGNIEGDADALAAMFEGHLAITNIKPIELPNKKSTTLYDLVNC